MDTRTDLRRIVFWGMCLLSVQSAFRLLDAATVSSVNEGGIWSETQTWVGGTVPLTTDDIVINGTVSLHGGTSCASLTVSQNAILQNGGGLGWLTLIVNGTVTNSGTIRNNPSGNALWIELHGDIVNNGTWMPGGTYIASDRLQRISQAVGTELRGAWIRKNAAGYSDTFPLVAMSDLVYNTDRFEGTGYKTGIGSFWSKLDMGGHDLVLKGATSFFSSVLSGTRVFSCLDSSAVSSIVVESPVTLGGRFTAVDGKVTFNGDVIVRDTLQNGGGLGWLVVTFNAKITNQGTIRNNPGGNALWVELHGDIVNNGTWAPAGTYIGSTRAQTISQSSGTDFRGVISRKNAAGYSDTFPLVATSDISFDADRFDGNGYKSGTGNFWSKFDMGGNDLTLKNGTSFFGSVLTRTRVFTCKDSSYVSSLVLQDSVTIGGRFTVIDGRVTFNGGVTIRDTLQNGGALGWLTVVFNDRLKNSGLIRNNPRGNALWIELNGDIVNNGTWTPAKTCISSLKEQRISQLAETEFRGTLQRKNATGYSDTFPLVAGTDIVVNLDAFDGAGYKTGTGYFWSRLDMQGHSLVLRGATSCFGTVLQNAGKLASHDSSVISNMLVEGPTTLGGRVTITDANVTLSGTVTVQDTLQNGGGLGWVTLNVKGKLINNGLIRNNPRGNDLWIDVTGDISNRKRALCRGIYVRQGSASSLIDGVFDCELLVTNKTVAVPEAAEVNGILTVNKRFEVGAVKTLTVPVGGILKVNGPLTSAGTIVNRGMMIRTIGGLSNGATYALPGQNVDIQLLNKGSADTMIVTCVAEEAHPVKASSLKRHWKLVADKAIGSYSLTLRYDDRLLNGSTENNLDVYVSSDNGSTWKIVSSPVNMTRDTSGNQLVVGTSGNPITEGFGDIVMSSQIVAPQPSIGFALVGRNNIRVGPPNRFTVTYWNRSDYPAGESMIKLSATGGISFSSAIFYDSISGKQRIVPIDSMIVDGDKTEFLVQTPQLAPRQVRSFDIIALAAPDVLTKSERIQVIPPAILIGLGYLVIGGVWNYYQNYGLEVATETCYQMFFTSEDSASYRILFEKAIREVEARYAKRTTEVEVKEIANYIGKTIVEEVASVALWPLEVLAAGKDCFVRVLVDMYNKKHGSKCGITIVPQTKRLAVERTLEFTQGDWNHVCYSRPLPKVTSWDPNEKHGPRGAGSKGYVSGADPMTYTIFFENKKEATAPAYRIEVLDTLDQAAFDVSSVQFVRTSHPRVATSRTANVLSWVFDSIELPPNVKAPEGEGWVQFTVRPKPGLTDGSQMQNTTTITFDVNKPITTNATLNAIDRKAPVTTISGATYIDSAHVELAFSVADSGAGCQSSSVFLSTDSGSFSLVALVDSLRVIVPVPRGKSHRFYVLSQDLVGNLELSASTIFKATSIARSNSSIVLSTALQRIATRSGSKQRVRFTLSSRERVDIAVYDFAGRKVAQLLDMIVDPGIHDVTFNVAGIGSKSYVVLMKAGQFSARRSMMIVK